MSTPLLAAAPLLAGLIGPALVGAAPARQQADAPAGVPAVAPARLAERTDIVEDIVEHVAARTATDQRRVLAYWTPERMARALPIDLLGLVERGLKSGGLLRNGGLLGSDLPGGLLGGDLPGGLTRGLTQGLTGGAPGHLAGGASGQPASGAPRRLASGDAATPAGGAGLPGPRELMAAARPLAEPAAGRPARPAATTSGSRWITGGQVARTTGRVFLTVAGVDFVCSASTVKSANRDVVITAGHCVKDGTGEWAANWTFVPAYGTAGPRPYGQYTARRMFVAGPWSRSADDNYDVGMVALATSKGRHVTDVVGGQDIAFNTPRGGQAFGFGYPADPPYDGSHLVYCAGRLRKDPHGQTRDQGLGCDMTAGASGGPWLTSFDAATGKGTIMSLSSFKYSDDRRTMYGPYFGDTIKALFRTAERA
ncbi:trypsin-like serine peptidase [Nonomuraea sp. NPDC049309]|uniref:trypsin-like serine peptidase n=1 Tax=Nonomuraea sp. NPDC049309 TaxID=3364350 RepID=UPI0037164550